MRQDEAGSVLVLVLGLAVVLGLLVAVVADAGQVFLARRSLDAVSDAAALAGAQAVDLDAVYAGGSGPDLALDENAVREAVERHLDATGADAAVPGFVLDAVEVEGATVTVRTRARVRLRLTGTLTGTATATVRTTATARNHLET